MVSGIGLGMNMVAQWMKQVLYGMKDERNYYTLQKKSVIQKAIDSKFKE